MPLHRLPLFAALPAGAGGRRSLRVKGQRTKIIIPDAASSQCLPSVLERSLAQQMENGCRDPWGASGHFSRGQCPCSKALATIQSQETGACSSGSRRVEGPTDTTVLLHS